MIPAFGYLSAEYVWFDPRGGHFGYLSSQFSTMPVKKWLYRWREAIQHNKPPMGEARQIASRRILRTESCWRDFFLHHLYLLPS